MAPNPWFPDVGMVVRIHGFCEFVVQCRNPKGYKVNLSVGMFCIKKITNRIEERFYLELEMTSKPTVLVVGGTGRTGSSIVEGLLESGNFVSHVEHESI